MKNEMQEVERSYPPQSDWFLIVKNDMQVVVAWDDPLLRPSSTHTLSLSLQDARLRALCSPTSTHSHRHKSPHHKRDEHQASPATPSGTLLSIASTLISHPDTSAILRRRASRAASASLSHPTRSPLTSHSATSTSPPASSPPPRPASSDASRVTVTFDSPSTSSSPPRPASAGASRSTCHTTVTPVHQPRYMTYSKLLQVVYRFVCCARVWSYDRIPCTGF